MDAFTLVKVASALWAQRQTAQERDRFEQLVAGVDAKVDAVLESPLHQGMSRLQLAAAAEPLMRDTLLDEARQKFDDAASQPAIEQPKRAGAAFLVAACLLEAGHKQAAAGAMTRALQLTDSWLVDVHHVAFETTYGSEHDPMYLRLDEATRAADSVLALAEHLDVDVPGISEQVNLLQLPTLSANRAAVGSGSDRFRPAPGPEACDFLDYVEPSKLASVWHRLRPALADDSSVRWFCRAGALRLLGTADHVVAYHPDGLKEGRGVRFRLRYGAISEIDTATGAASIRLICGGDHGHCVHDLDLNDWITEDVVGRLRLSVESARLPG